MKRILGILVLGLLVGTLAAQDINDEMELYGNLGDVAFTYSQQATSGTLARNTDGTFALTLTGIPDAIAFTESNTGGVTALATADLVADWNASIQQLAASLPSGAANPLYSEGQLMIGQGAALLTIRGAAYDAASASITYDVDVLVYLASDLLNTPFESLVMTAQADMKTLPTTFEAPTLLISGNNTFLSALQDATLLRLAVVRDTRCVTARDRIGSLEQAFDTAVTVVTDLLASSGSAEAFASANQQVDDLNAELFITRRWYAVNCK